MFFVESKDGKLRNVSFEALTVAKQLAGGGEVIAALFGTGATEFVQEVSQYGSNKVYVLENEALVTLYDRCIHPGIMPGHRGRAGRESF